MKYDTVFPTFEAFLLYVGERPSSQHKLRRPDTKRPYGPGNCEWSLLHGRTGQLIEFDGLRLTATEWASRLGITKQALSQRLAKHELAVALSPVHLKRGPRRRTSG